jgi:hypothetical protein
MQSSSKAMVAGASQASRNEGEPGLAIDAGFSSSTVIARRAMAPAAKS